MLSRLRIRNGSRYTLASIVLIIVMLYFFRYTLGGKNTEYPSTVYFEGQKYAYIQIIKDSPFKFKRNYGKNYEGYVLLTKRGEGKDEMLDKVYIFEGGKTYREYKLQK